MAVNSLNYYTISSFYFLCSQNAQKKNQLQEGQINGSQTHLIFSVLGKTYMLLFKSVKAEDAGEIKFTAEKASSAAKLKVKGSLSCLSYLHAFCI